jgi:hypothetical protein
MSKTIVYWVEGFSLTTTAVIGIIGNLVSVLQNFFCRNKLVRWFVHVFI